MTPWPVRYRRGSAGDLHQWSAAQVSSGAPLGRAVWVMVPSAPSLVLGSTQRDEVADPGACLCAGVALVRRRSGGGAVLVGPGEQIWVDVVLPRGDPLWSDDVGRATWWVGEAWAAALSALGVPAPTVWKGGLVRTEWSELVCFAGRGPGEVLSATGAKLVDISQRRSRTGAVFQTSCLLRWSPGALTALLALPGPDRERATRELEHLAEGVDLPGGRLLDAFVASLP